MCSTFLLAQPCTGVSRGKILSQKSTVKAAYSGENIELRNKGSSIFPGLSTLRILQTDIHVHEIVERQSQAKNLAMEDAAFRSKRQFNPVFLKKACERCRKICAECAKNFYLGTLLLTMERQKAIWAIFVWCQRTDELVDGPNAFCMNSAALDRWEERLKEIFHGNPCDMLDAALTDTVFNFHSHTKPFCDMIEVMRLDTKKCRYENFQELYLYCYYAGGTVGLMNVPIMGISQEFSASAQNIYNSAIYLGFGNQLTNILRDVGEEKVCCSNSLAQTVRALNYDFKFLGQAITCTISDASRGRVYLPQDELAQFGISNNEVFSRKLTNRWREFMKEQITRARFLFNLAGEGASKLDKASRWPIWSSF